MDWSIFLGVWESIIEFYYRSVFYYDNQSFLGKVLIVEAVLIISSMLALFFYHKINNLILKRLKKSQNDLQVVCENYLGGDEINWESLVQCCKNLSLSLPTLEKLNKNYSENIDWLFLLDELLDKHLLPIAREQATSIWWTKRNWALRALSLSPRKKDETLFLNFLMDPIAHNRFAAIKPLIKVGTKSSQNVIIELMKKENRHTQAVYIEMMKIGGDQLFQTIRERLRNDPNPDAKRVCIDILSESLEQSDLFIIKQSISSPDKALRLTAIRCLGKFEAHHSTQILLKFLDDEEWEVRSLAAKFLGIRQAYQAIPNLLKNTSDRSWWVRMNSVSALNKMGFSGKSALETITPEKDRYAYEMVQYVHAIEVNHEENKDNSEVAIAPLTFDPAKKKDAA